MIQIASTPLFQLTINAYTSHVTRLEVKIAVGKSIANQTYLGELKARSKVSALQKERDDSLDMLKVLKNELQKNESDD